MNQFIPKLATIQSPQVEGCALALSIINQIINKITKTKQEPKALHAHHINLNLSSKTLKSQSTTSLSLPSSSTITADTTITSKHLNNFTSKSIEIFNELKNKKCKTFVFRTVPSDFYQRDIEYRSRNYLSATSIGYLCKSLLMKNSKCIHDDCNDRLNSKYYIVVYQYNKKLHNTKLTKFIKSLSNKSNKYYRFSLASLEETKQLTSFEYNCVGPIGSCNIPIIISHHIVANNFNNYKYIWIGSGSINIKLRIDTKELCSKFDHFIADITKD